ncbi:MAG: ABC transporter ATP-binding protein [Betaproteobacteria bacterium]|nr:ABC transporter ATP-binding protein [Betaproteobacteria bacterium]
MAEPVLRLADVRKTYNAGSALEAEVLHGISLELAPGEFAALVGPSGSGKSTLLNIVGLLERPTHGTVHVAGNEATALDEAGVTRLRGRTIGFVFQFHHLIPAFTALENVMMPQIIDHGRPSDAMAASARDLLARVGLSGKERSRPQQLSGGQQQRVAIARALAGHPALVLADEPTGNLDSKTADEVFHLMREFNMQQGSAFLLVTHDARLARRCDRVIELFDGRIVSSGAALAESP